MAEVLVDTSALIAFFVGSEKHHLSVKNYFLSNPDSKWVILSTVFDETVTWLRVKIWHWSVNVGWVLKRPFHADKKDANTSITIYLTSAQDFNS